MIELTLEQRQAVAQQGETPPRAVDPDTHTTYVLIQEEVYTRVRGLLDEEEGNQFLRDMYSHVMEVFGQEGWDDPAMDIYNRGPDHERDAESLGTDAVIDRDGYA